MGFFSFLFFLARSMDGTCGRRVEWVGRDFFYGFYGLWVLCVALRHWSVLLMFSVCMLVGFMIVFCLYVGRFVTHLYYSVCR